MRSAPWITIGLFLGSVASAAAGMILTEQETRPGPQGGTETITRTVTIEGNRQKSTDGKHTSIIDLDKGTMTMLDDEAKTGMEMALSNEGPGAMFLAGMLSSFQGLKPTGAPQTVAGYACDEYKGTLKMIAETSITSCFSKDAPGAAEYAAFYKKMLSRLGADAKAALGSFPEGVALASESTTTSPDLSAMLSGMPAEQRKMMAEAMANQGPQVVRTKVTSIKSASVPADAFAVPAGYSTQRMDSGAMGGD